MKEIHYDAEGDILTVNFVKTTNKPQAVTHVGFEIARNVVFYSDPIQEKPLEIILLSHSRLVKYTQDKVL